MNKPVSIFAGLILLIYCSCSSKKEDPVDPGGGGGGGGVNCEGVAKTFSANVQPIIQASCQLSGCHDGASTNGPGPLTTYNQIKNASVRIRAAVISRQMPKGGSLTDAQIKSIVCWIDSGSPNN
ncbi:c-type cytochrome [Pseudoflavitalea rhizosphaerae]|uniref:c-type cytochrome n=1 Tax=Pseudoflavitalea rhizosphaerae TaxID=1884793 RepID=UPI000F8C7157|nr:hypothetical protein [Pseudoflavitalea rhizosphaerae]